MNYFQRVKQLRFTGSPQSVMLLRLLFVLFFILFTRLLLYFLHPGLFPNITSYGLLYYSFTGLRFDIPALLYFNIVYILLVALPFRFRRTTIFTRIADFAFLVPNIVLLIPNLIDCAYYPFSLKRLTFDIFSYISTGDDTASMMPQFLRDYWFLLVILLIGIMLLIVLVKTIRISKRYVMQPNYLYYPSQLIITFIIASFALLGVRGGTQLKPVGILSAAQYAPSEETPLVLNSAFTLLRSYGQQGLPEVRYFVSDTKMNSIFSVRKNYAAIDSTGNVLEMNRKNVFIIILESFSAEHIGALNKNLGKSYQSYTPFLDSLSAQCAVYNGFANGKRSIEGIPAILASLPTWMPQDFITSQFGSNSFNSLAGLLKKEGYSSVFFHGGKNGTMGFDAFSKSAGFDLYSGKNEYPNPSDFDGHWGIWDEPYLQYIAGELNHLRQPFLGTVFTLSSHHPYKLPAGYSNKFKKGPLDIQQTIMYTDYALKQFFKTAATMPWYKNTLFVITADHTSEAWLPFYKTRVGQYRIPIWFFDPASPDSLLSDQIAQQTDIMPTILDKLHYSRNFYAFGNSLLRPAETKFSLSYLNGNYQLIFNNLALQTDLERSGYLFNVSNDSLLTRNILSRNNADFVKMDALLNAIVQQYNNRMNHNKLSSD